MGSAAASTLPESEETPVAAGAAVGLGGNQHL